MRLSLAELKCRAAIAVLVAVGFLLASPGHALAAGGQISGRVTDAASSLGIGSVEVDVYDAGQDFVTSTQTGTDGTYTISGLATGTYEVGFVPTSGNYLSQFFSGEASLAAADAVSVTTGATTLGINAALAPGGQISGTVTNETMQGIGSVEVDVYDPGHNFVTSTMTAADGTYTVSGLASGSYEIGFLASSGNFAAEFYSGRPSLDTADPVSVTAGSMTSLPSAVLMTAGQISGTVTDASSAGLPGVEVDVYDANNNFVTSTQTGMDGTYMLAGLFPGSYKVGFVPSSVGYASQFNNGKLSLAAADLVPVTGGATTTLPTATLGPGGQIAGTVTDASSQADVARESVVVYDTNGTVVASATTAADGTYTVVGLAAGNYEVGFFPGGPYAVQFYSGGATLAVAAQVVVTAGLTTTGIDAALQPPTSTLSVSLAGNGSGTVTGSPIGSGPQINCPGACSQSYVTDISVTLTASAAAGSTFAGWSGGGCGTASVCTVALSSSLAVTADFAANPPAPPSPPSNTVLPSVSGNTTTGQTLSAHTGSWSGTAPLAYAYQWQRCSPGCANIVGATGSSYRLAAADTGARILVEVTASNAAGRASAQSAPVGPVGPSLAQIKSLLSTVLVPTGKPARIAAILRAGGYTFKVKAAAAGLVEIRWYLVPPGAHLTKGKARKPVLVATGQLIFARAGTGKLKVKLSAAGRHDLKRAQRITLSAKASFALTGKAPVNVIKRFKLRR